MSNFFKRHANTAGKQEEIRVSSRLGREVTSIKSATEELHKSPGWRDPRGYIQEAAEKNLCFYGLDLDGKPVFVPESDVTMEIYIGSTGTGKGVLLGNRVAEAIRKEKGVIIVDPKTDSFLPAICKEELARQGREDDFVVASWPHRFAYDGVNENDNYIDIANKLIDAFDLQETGDAGVDYYRKNQRVILKKALKLFLDGTLGDIPKKNLHDIARFVQHLKEDLEKQELLEKELAKPKANFNKIQQLQKRFFDTDKVSSAYWDATTIESLDSLAKNFAELLEAANITNSVNLDSALYEGKVIYFRVDMLDIASLKMVKIMIADAIQKARRRKANTVIIADELSFYANSTIAGALATVRSFGLKFMLALQDIAQMKDEHIRNAILSNCNIKFFYKASDKTTLEYIEMIGGEELVTKFAKSAEGEKYTQEKEPFLNRTRIRALPRAGAGVLVAEYLPAPKIVHTFYVPVEKPFDWSEYDKPQKDKTPTLSKIAGEYKFRTVPKEARELIEGSDLWGVEFETEIL